jgi:hypothetical protein
LWAEVAVLEGWRSSSVDADLDAPRDDIFREVQAIKGLDA